MCSCNSCPNLIMATQIAIEASATDPARPNDYLATITVPATFAPTKPQKVCIGLRVAIPNADNVNCFKVAVTNGTSTWNVETACGDNWRPCKLKCRSVLKMRFLTDPAHFVIEQVKR